MTWKRAIIFCIGLWGLQLAPVFAQTLPDPPPERQILDLSGKLSDNYLNRIEAQLQAYPFEVKVVYLPASKNVHLGKYAAKLFKHWQMPEDQLLLVVALDRKKIGVHAGTALKGMLKQDQEMPLPSSSPNSSAPPPASPDPTLPLDVAAEMDHLELIPEAIDQVSQSLQQQTPDRKRPSAEPAAEDPLKIEQESSPRTLRNSRSQLEPGEWLWLLLVAGAVLLLGLAWVLFRIWQRWHKNQELINRYSLQGEVVYEQLEQLYESLEKIMPDFHGYLGETEKTLGLFVKSMHQLQESLEIIFDDFETETRHLSQRDERETAIDFFRDLENKQAEGQQLYEQALNVLKNLKDVRLANQQLFEQAEQRRQSFSQEISEIRQLNKALSLTRIQQSYQQSLQELKRFEKRNERDPLGVEKDLKQWRKQLAKIEQETRSLPHLWQQFNTDLKQRIAQLRTRLQEQSASPADQQQLTEIERLHRTLQQAIEQGDLAQLNRWNERFTQKLQELESRY